MTWHLYILLFMMKSIEMEFLHVTHDILLYHRRELQHYFQHPFYQFILKLLLLFLKTRCRSKSCEITTKKYQRTVKLFSLAIANWQQNAKKNEVWLYTICVKIIWLSFVRFWCVYDRVRNTLIQSTKYSKQQMTIKLNDRKPILSLFLCSRYC